MNEEIFAHFQVQVLIETPGEHVQIKGMGRTGSDMNSQCNYLYITLHFILCQQRPSFHCNLLRRRKLIKMDYLFLHIKSIEFL